MKRLRSIGVGVLLATVAWCSHAEIVSTNLPVPLLMHDDFFGTPYPIDLNGDGITDFTFSADDHSVALIPDQGNRVVYRVDPPPNLGGPLASLASGFLVASNLNDASFGWRSNDLGPALIVLVLSTGSTSDFNGRGYVGLEFGLADGIHYGYFDVDARPGFPSATLHGWAYETTPGVPIVAGAVPEPGSVWLSLLGVAVLTFAARHRRLQGTAHTKPTGL